MVDDHHRIGCQLEQRAELLLAAGRRAADVLCASQPAVLALCRYHGLTTLHGETPVKADSHARTGTMDS